jgi:hypothetical protein
MVVLPRREVPLEFVALRGGKSNAFPMASINHRINPMPAPKPDFESVESAMPMISSIT